MGTGNNLGGDEEDFILEKMYTSGLFRRWATKPRGLEIQHRGRETLATMTTKRWRAFKSREEGESDRIWYHECLFCRKIPTSGYLKLENEIHGKLNTNSAAANPAPHRRHLCRRISSSDPSAHSIMAASTTSAGTKTTMCLTSLPTFAAGSLTSSSSMEGSTVSPGSATGPACSGSQYTGARPSDSGRSWDMAGGSEFDEPRP